MCKKRRHVFKLKLFQFAFRFCHPMKVLEVRGGTPEHPLDTLANFWSIPHSNSLQSSDNEMLFCDMVGL
jgi:hypothetical protein